MSSRALNNVFKLAVRRDLERDFGAVDSSTVDSGAAIAAAFAWARLSPQNQIEARGANYLSKQALSFDRAKLQGYGGVLKFDATVGAAVDCLTLGGSSSSQQLVWEGLNVDCSSGGGRDAVVIAGGGLSGTANNFMRLRSFQILSATRDGLTYVPAAANDWLQNWDVTDVEILNPGRRGIAMLVGNFANTFANQGVFNNVDIRGAGRLLAADDVWCDSQGTSAAMKISEVTWVSCDLDTKGAANHNQCSVSLNMSGTQSAYDGWRFISCTLEDTSFAKITGFPDAVQVNNSANCRGFTWDGGVPSSYGRVINPASIGWGHVISGSGNSTGATRNFVKRDMGGNGFSATQRYANDAAAGTGGIGSGCEFLDASGFLHVKF